MENGKAALEIGFEMATASNTEFPTSYCAIYSMSI
jgi:hypothetical protein